MVREGMRGDDQQQNHMFSYLSPESRVRRDHPLRAILARWPIRYWIGCRFLFRRAVRHHVGRPSVPPEKLLRALLIQMLYSVRSEAADGRDRL